MFLFQTRRTMARFVFFAAKKYLRRIKNCDENFHVSPQRITADFLRRIRHHLYRQRPHTPVFGRALRGVTGAISQDRLHRQLPRIIPILSRDAGRPRQGHRPYLC